MRAIRARTGTCAYDIEVSWGEGTLLAAEHVADAASFMLWTDERAPEPEARGFVVDPSWLAGEFHTLVTCTPDALVVHAPGRELVLRAGEQACVVIGPLTFRVTATSPRSQASFAMEHVDLRPHAWTAASVALHGLALVCMVFMPPKASSMSLDLLDEDARYLRYLATPLARESMELPWRADRAAGDRESSAAPHAGEAGAAGTPDTRARGKRLGIEGRAERRAPSRLTPSDVRRAGLLGVLAGAGSPMSPSSPFGPDSPLGYDARTALGELMGEEVGESSGIGGLSLRGPGRAGGGDASGTIGLDGIDTGGLVDGVPGTLALGHPSRTGRVPPPIATSVEVRGALSKEAIRRTIQRHLSEVRFCYEQALAQRPELAGRVNVSFLIMPSGVVQDAVIASSSLESAVAESCVAEAVRRWAFPAPDGGGYVRVTYPFVFERAGE